MNSMYNDQANLVQLFNENNRNISDTLKQEAARASQTFKAMKTLVEEQEERIRESADAYKQVFEAN